MTPNMPLIPVKHVFAHFNFPGGLEHAPRIFFGLHDACVCVCVGVGVGVWVWGCGCGCVLVWACVCVRGHGRGRGWGVGVCGCGCMHRCGRGRVTVQLERCLTGFIHDVIVEHMTRTQWGRGRGQMVEEEEEEEEEEDDKRTEEDEKKALLPSRTEVSTKKKKVMRKMVTSVNISVLVS